MRSIALMVLITCSSCSDDLSEPMPAPKEHVLVVDYSLPAFDGKLLGTDKGEWVGSLMHQDEAWKIHTLLNENVHGIIQNKAGIFVFTGLSHLSTNEGYIYTVTQGQDRAINTKLLGRLPGAPSQVRQLSDGSTSFLVYVGYKSDSPYFECYSLTGKIVSRSLDCLPP
jgi:hypothetical protein